MDACAHAGTLRGHELVPRRGALAGGRAARGERQGPDQPALAARWVQPQGYRAQRGRPGPLEGRNVLDDEQKVCMSIYRHQTDVFDRAKELQLESNVEDFERLNIMIWVDVRVMVVWLKRKHLTYIEYSVLRGHANGTYFLTGVYFAINAQK